MLKKILIITTILSTLLTNINAQQRQATMSFNKTTHDFGKIKEEDGDARVTFKFQNTGLEPVVITNVRTTCGCTSPKWTNKPVQAGQEGQIEVVYHARHRPGNFNKTIIVYSNAQNSPVNLKIKGNVQRKPLTIEDKYRYSVGDLRFKRTSIHFANLYNDQTRREKVEFINVSKESIALTLHKRTPKKDFLKVTVSPQVVAPGEKGVVTIEYDAKLKNAWDYVRDNITFDVNGKYDSRYRLSVSATIKEHFTDKDLQNAPAITFVTPEVYEFGNIIKGEVVEHIFKFKNTGKSDLKIRKVKASCGCTATTIGKKIIAPGEEGTIKARFNSSSKKGTQRNTITMIVNIPGKTNGRENSRVIFSMKGFVSQE